MLHMNHQTTVIYNGITVAGPRNKETEGVVSQVMLEESCGDGL